jgi:hypothetical protein
MSVDPNLKVFMGLETNNYPQIADLEMNDRKAAYSPEKLK